MVLPWGGNTASKSTRKWKNRVTKRREAAIEKRNYLLVLQEDARAANAWLDRKR